MASTATPIVRVAPPVTGRAEIEVVSLPLADGMSDDEAPLVVDAWRRAITVRTR